MKPPPAAPRLPASLTTPPVGLGTLWRHIRVLDVAAEGVLDVSESRGILCGRSFLGGTATLSPLAPTKCSNRWNREALSASNICRVHTCCPLFCGMAVGRGVIHRPFTFI